MANIKIKNIILKKVLPFSVVSLFLIQIFYVTNEPNLVQGASQGDSVTVSLTVEAGLTITTPADVTMAPNISMSTNGSIGNAAWTVKTNAPAGYTLNVKASTTPALKSGSNSFTDFTEAVSGTPEAWSVTNAQEFGFSAYGSNTDTGVWGTGASCGSAGAPVGTMRYVGFKTTDKAIATTNTVTPVAGTTTTLCLAAEQDGIYAQSGTYTATITATAVTL